MVVKCQPQEESETGQLWTAAVHIGLADVKRLRTTADMDSQHVLANAQAGLLGHQHQCVTLCFDAATVCAVLNKVCACLEPNTKSKRSPAYIGISTAAHREYVCLKDGAAKKRRGRPTLPFDQSKPRTQRAKLAKLQHTIVKEIAEQGGTGAEAMAKAMYERNRYPGVPEQPKEQARLSNMDQLCETSAASFCSHRAAGKRIDFACCWRMLHVCDMLAS